MPRRPPRRRAPEPDIFDQQAAFCKVFSSPIRLRILYLLAERETSVGEIAESLSLSMANVSQHLRLMRDQGAVVPRRRGRSIFYAIANRKFIAGARLVREGLREELRQRARAS